MDLYALERLSNLRKCGALTDAEFLEQKQILLSKNSAMRAVSKKSIGSNAPSRAIFAIVASLIFIAAVTSITKSNKRESHHSGNARISEKSGITGFVGSASDLEREAYSHDLYDRPTGLSGESAERYDRLSPEGQEYVDEQMALYDATCARSNAC